MKISMLAKTMSIAAATSIAAGSAPLAQGGCSAISIPDGAEGIAVQGHSANGPRCFVFTPGDGRSGRIEIVGGNATLGIEGVTINVTRFDFDPGPWTYYIDVSPDPFGSAGGLFTMQVQWR